MVNVFIIQFHVRPAEDSIMPLGFAGAYVSCYSPGSTYIEATERALKRLTADGLVPEEILEPIHEMDSTLWLEHLIDQWPDHIASMPSQSEFENAVCLGEVVYGPFGTYN